MLTVKNPQVIIPDIKDIESLYMYLTKCSQEIDKEINEYELEHSWTDRVSFDINDLDDSAISYMYNKGQSDIYTHVLVLLSLLKKGQENANH